MNSTFPSDEGSSASDKTTSKTPTETASQAPASPTANLSGSVNRNRPPSTQPQTSLDSTTLSKPDITTSGDITLSSENDAQKRQLCWFGSRGAKLDNLEQDEAFERATARVAPRKRKSGNPVLLNLLMDGNLHMEDIHLRPDADSDSGPNTMQLPETGQSSRKSVKLNELLLGTITPQHIRIRLPTERPTLAAQRELEHQRQCLAAFMDNEEEWHRCHVLFDPWCERDLVSTALIRGLIEMGKIEELRVPEEFVEELGNMLDPRRTYPLESYVQLPRLRFEYRKGEVIKNKELYLINNEEESFIIFSQASMVKHGIRLEDLPKDEHGSFLQFTNLQFNAGVLKFKHGKNASKDNEEHRKKSQAKNAEKEKSIKARREEEDAARAADFRSTTSTQTTWSEQSGWSSAAASSQATRLSTDDGKDSHRSSSR